jgi:predicted cupin superfamily sugar epimerase
VNADEVIARFGLVPLVAEGGFVNRYWPSADDTEVAPGSAIWFLVTDAPDGCSRFHRLTIDEIWHRYLGDPAELVLLDRTARAATSCSATTSPPATSSS